MYEAIDSRNARNWCEVLSFQNQTLNALHALDTTLVLHKLITFDLPFFPLYFDSAIRFGGLKDYHFVKAVSFNRRFISRGRISMMKKRGYRVLVWTVNDPDDMDWLIRMGVDGIVTDFPDMAGKNSNPKE